MKDIEFNACWTHTQNSGDCQQQIKSHTAHGPQKYEQKTRSGFKELKKFSLPPKGEKAIYIHF